MIKRYFWFVLLEAVLIGALACSVLAEAAYWIQGAFLLAALMALFLFYQSNCLGTSDVQNFLASAEVGILFLNPDFTVRAVSASSMRLLKREEQNLLGRNFFSILFDNSPEQAPLQENLRRSGAFEGEVAIKPGSGSKLPVQLGVGAVRDPGGRIFGYIAYLFDLQKQKEITRELLQTGKLAAIGELASGVAHEVNNPLATIAINSEMLLEDLNSGEEIKRDFFSKCLQLITEQSFRCKKITQRLLDFSRKQAPTLAEFDIHNLLRDALELIAYEVKGKHIALEYDLKLAPSNLVSDPQQITQVLLNVLTNAIDASFKDSVLTIRTRSEENCAVIEVQDYGNGIKPEELDRIFEAFYTTKPQGKGTGLGLPICRKILTGLGGSIELQSEYGEGTVVIIKLPLKLSERIEHA
jgi:signal transduction histidine kinase